MHSTKVSTYIQNCYSYALVQNKDDEVGTERALRNITSRVLAIIEVVLNGCQCFEDPYRKYAAFPYGKPSQGAELLGEIAEIFEKHPLNAYALKGNLSSIPNE